MTVDAIELRRGAGSTHPPPIAAAQKQTPCQQGQGDQRQPLTQDRSTVNNQCGLDAIGLAEPPTSYPLDVVFADELPDTYTPPDEIVEGVLTAGAGSVLYGDSNSGKTFLVIDLACSIARGVRWMGKRTEPGLVVYLAAESPASVRARLQAYQRHYGLKVPNFAIVQNPIDLFDGEADTDKVIQTVRQVAERKGLPLRLIVGDTLARLSAGANENAGQDMGLVVKRFDRIRTECNAHFMLIHHSGKNAAAGARGWSGVRAAVDTELEVTDGPGGRCCETTKQRDLSTKGERIWFRLDAVDLGHTKWDTPATNCVVVPTAPDGESVKRVKLPAGGNQRIVWDALGELFKVAGDARPTDAPKELPHGRPCIRLDDAIEKTRDRIACEPKRKTERVRQALTGLVSRGLLTLRGEFIWIA